MLIFFELYTTSVPVASLGFTGSISGDADPFLIDLEADFLVFYEVFVL